MDEYGEEEPEQKECQQERNADESDQGRYWSSQ